MKTKIKVLVVTLLCLMLIPLFTGCGGDKTPYEINNEDNY